MSSAAAAQPYAGHYSPVTAATMIFAPPNMYSGMVAAYHSTTPTQSSNVYSPPQSGTSPIISSPSPSVASSSNVAATPSTPSALCEPSSPANSYTTVVHNEHSPTENANKTSVGGSPTETLSPPIVHRKPLFPSNRFSSEGSYQRPRPNEQNTNYSYTSSHNSNHQISYQTNKFKTPPLQYKRTQGEQQMQPYSNNNNNSNNHNNNNFHQSYQPTPLIAGNAPAPFRQVNPAYADKFRTNGPRPRPPNLDLRRSVSMASTASTISPGATNDISKCEQQTAATASTPTSVHHIPHTAASNYRMANSYVEGNAAAAIHQHQQQHAATFYSAAAAAGAMGAAAYGGSGVGSPGMYVKLGGAFFAHHVSG